MVAGIDRAPLKVTRPDAREGPAAGAFFGLKEMRQANVQEEDHEAHQGEVGALVAAEQPRWLPLFFLLVSSPLVVLRPFVKYVNYNHIMPTRYQVPECQGLQHPERC